MRYETYLKRISTLERKITRLLAREERLNANPWHLRFFPAWRERALQKAQEERFRIAAARASLEAEQFAAPSLIWNGNPAGFRPFVLGQPEALASLTAAADAALKRQG